MKKFGKRLLVVAVVIAMLSGMVCQVVFVFSGKQIQTEEKEPVKEVPPIPYRQ